MIERNGTVVGTVKCFQADLAHDLYKEFRQHDLFGTYHAVGAKPVLHVNNPDLIKVSSRIHAPLLDQR